ncbi:MAG: hypothetical protein Q9M48_10515 [Rhodobacterales bacterium]|nr:hypothetical protein [Rhodobacterales bacterium]
MSEPSRSVFLERQTYRRRRLMDAARMLPIVGILLWALPLLWPQDPEQAVTTSGAMRYIFGIWVLLVALSLWLSRRLKDTAETDASRPN